MAQQQQTVLKVRTNRELSTFTVPDALLLVNTGDTTMTVSGSGTTENPYSGTTPYSLAYFDVSGNTGIVYFDVTGMADDLVYTPANVYLIRNGVQYLIRRSTKTILQLTGQINVIPGDIIYISNPNPDTNIGINSLYIVTDNTTNINYEYTTLDLYGDIPIKINKSFAELQDISKRNSDFSIGLVLPGTKTNNAFFENFFNVDVDTLYFNPLLRIPAQVLINDEVYFDGYIKLNKINVLNSKVEYDVTLFSNISDLFGKIGNNLLKDLPFDDPFFMFNHNFTLENVYGSWDELGFNYSGNPQTYFYPITHNGYNYTGDTVNLSGGTTEQQTRLFTSSSPIDDYPSEAAMFAAGVKPYRINVSNYGILDNQLKPALNIWSIIQLMFKTYGYSIKSDFMNTPWMKGLYMYGYFNSDNTKFSLKTPVPQSLPLSGVEVILIESIVSQIVEYPCGSPGYFKTTRKYDIYVVKKGTGTPALCTDPITVGLSFTLFPCDGSGPIDSPVTVAIPANTTGATYSWISDQYVDCGSGCPYSFELLQNNGFDPATSNVTESTNALAYLPLAPNTSINIEDGDYVNFGLVIDENIKQIDLLAGIAKKFNLIFVPDPEVPNQIIIEPYQYYVGTGSIYDWTDKLSWDKGFSVQPAQNFIESEIIFTDQEDGDDGNKIFKDKNNRIYGQNYVYNETDFKSQTKKIDTIFSPQVVRKWDNNIKVPLGINYVSSNKSTASGDTEKVSWEYKGVKTKPKLFYYLGNKNIIFDSINDVYNATYVWNTYYINIGSSDATSWFETIDAPVISNVMPMGNPDSNKINNDSISILFNSEEPTDVGVEPFTGITSYTDRDMYNLFYENRINNLYNPRTRFLTGYFNIKLSDLKNLSPRDLIKINEQYFTWNKITGFNMVNPELTQIELVQVENNPSSYPTRYFQYYYCADEPTKYNIATDFTNPQMNLGHFYVSNWYDYNVGLLGGNVSGFTTSFRKGLGEYLPFNIYEVDYDTFNTTGSTYADDPNIDWDSVGTMNANMATYWATTGSTGINLWEDCSGFTTTASAYGFTVISPSGGTPTSPYTTGITLNITDTGWIKYDTASGTVYTYFGSLGNHDVPDCADCTTIRFAYPFADLATWTVVDCGNPC